MIPQIQPQIQAAQLDSRLSPIAALDEESLTLSVADGGGDSAAKKIQDTVEWLGVRVGPIGLLLPATAARELLDPPPTARLPHTPPWLAGLTNVRGALVPVVDTARALDVEHDTAARRYLLVFHQGAETIGLLVDGLPRRQSFAPGERLNGLPPHPAPLDGHLAAAYGRAGQLWFELELDGFFGTLAERMARA